MRRLTLAAILLLLIAPCCRRRNLSVETVEDGDPQLVSMIHAADPRAAIQLVRGFYDIEQNSWRWTMGKFAVTLRPPAGASKNGAVLQLKFAVPDAVIDDRLKSVTLKASISGVAMDPETYTKSGEYVYSREVPASSLTGETVTVDFALDKFLAAGMVEQRELGVVLTTVGLISK
jgi:hypothetical protein